MLHYKSLQLFRIILFLLVSIIIFVDGKEETSKATGVFNWLKKDKDFFFSHKLLYNDGIFRTRRKIKADEVLMVIPNSSILVAQQIEEEEDEEEEEELCLLLHTLWKEIDLGETSTYAPYVEYLLAAQTNRTRTPALWSNIGRRLLNMVSITLPRSHITTWIEGFEDCLEALMNTETCDANNPESCTANDLGEEGEENDTEANDEEVGEDGSLITHEVDPLEYSEEEKAHLNAFEITVQHHIDHRFLVPLYDQIEHHHFDFNVVHKLLEDNSVQVVALNDIAAGASLRRKSLTCLGDCESKNDTVTTALRNYGQVQSYPQYWTFPIGVSFIYDPSAKEPLQWIKEPFEFWNVEILENEYSKQLRMRENQINKSVQSIPREEWKQIDAYSHVLIRALQVTIADAYRIFDGQEEEEEEEEEDYDYSETDEGEGDAKESEEILEEEEEEEEEEDYDYSETDEGEGDAEESEEILEEEEEEEEEEDYDYSEADEVEGDAEESEEILEEEEEEEEEEDEFACDNACFDGGVPTNATGCEEAECHLGDIADLRGCPTYRYDAILNETEWVLMRSAYIAVVGPRKATIKLNYRSGMKVKYRVGFSPGRGRGVFSVKDIPKGTLVWTSEHTATFETGIQYTTFLRALPDFFVCDLLIWCYTAKDKDGVHFIGCDLDEGSLFNTYDDRAEYNIGPLKGTVGDYRTEERIYALRDITAGEELVTAYGQFDTDNFAAFDLM